MSADLANELAATVARAIDHHRVGDLAEAEDLYHQVLTIDPGQFDALHLLGVIMQQRGDPQGAVKLIEQAVLRDPSAYPAFNNLGLAYRSINDLERAAVSFRAAVALKPDYLDGLNNLATVLQAQGNLVGAVQAFKQVIALKPDFAEGHNSLGVALQYQGRLDQAVDSYRKALSLRPDFPEAMFNLAKAEEAQGKTPEALAGYQEVLMLRPEMAEAHFGLGSILQDQGMIEDALDSLSTALSLRPEYVEARWALTMSQLALVHDATKSKQESRTSFGQEIEALDRWFDESRLTEGVKGVGSQQPFFLAYQEENNRALLSQYGDLCVRLMDHWSVQQKLPPVERARTGLIRVGIVSAHIHDHSVWTAIVRGWCEHLDRARFSLHIFHVGRPEDKETEFARSRAATFVHGAAGLREWVQAINKQRLDIIIFPEVGMDPTTIKLASMRLAPLQLASWGHPETTGLSTIDYYLSAEDFEPPDATDNYRERLVRLPGLGCSYQRLNVEVPDLDLNELGIDTDLPILVCAGTPVKYAPEHDRVFVEIARRLDRCQFVFFHHFRQNLSDQLQQRLGVAFEQADMYFPEYSRQVPWLTRPAFYGLMERADVYLDTIGFSGFNTAMQAIECGLPIVAWEGRFMRGRFASAIMKKLGLGELVAQSHDAYVEIAVKLAQDSAYRQDVRHRIETRRDILYNDRASIQGLEQFLESAVNRAEH